MFIKITVFFLMGGVIIVGLNHTGFLDNFLNKKPKWPQNQNQNTVDNLKIKPLHTNITLPKIDAKTLKGQPFLLNDLQGQAVMLNFWASWCPPCREEFPDLVSATKASKGELALVAISNDSSLKDINTFLKSLKTLDLKHKDIYIIWDQDFKTARAFNVTKWPETFILDQKHRIIKKHAGALKKEDLIKNVLPLVVTHIKQ